jgi:ABC-type branched-subunit amino acid transport system substrate-binding protein
VCALLVAACANSSSNTDVVGSIGSEGDARDGSIKIAMLLPLSGSAQTVAVAKGMQQAAEMALFERNARPLQLLIKDDKGTEEGARAAAEEAIRGGAELIIGPLFAKSVSAAAPVARQANVPIIAFSNDERVAGNGVYLLSFLASQEVPRVVGYAVAQGRRRFAALVPDDAHGKMLEALFQSAVARNGGAVATVERYPIDVSGMLEPTQRIRDVIRGSLEAGDPVDTLFLPGGPDTLPSLGPMLPKTEIDPTRIKVIGTGGWDYPSARRERILEGGWFAAPDPRGWREFSERFAKTYKTMPPRLASLAYDAVTVAAALAPAPKEARYTAATLTRATGFAGIDGAFRLLANGLSERGLAVLEMQRVGPVVADPAPGLGVQQAFLAQPGASARHLAATEPR